MIRTKEKRAAYQSEPGPGRQSRARPSDRTPCTRRSAAPWRRAPRRASRRFPKQLAHAGRARTGSGGDDNSRGFVMCRNIRTLHNFKPPATAEEIRASAVQFVRKLSGFTRPSKANEAAFDRAVDLVADAAQELLAALVANAPPRDRDIETAKARARTAERFRA